ncbi:MAG: type II toxin-antitoxin system RelE/ParE family toxin [Bacteroidetes bacterium]|nr:type II toxin-antitoxin system RelE/ParE family toxin [Bacteroidota bacterium]
MAKRKKVIWSDKARQDLLEFLDFYNRRNGNIRYSARLLKEILKDISLLSAQAFLGKQTDHENIRVLVVWEYLIFHENHADIIFIINVWDSRRKPEKLY